MPIPELTVRELSEMLGRGERPFLLDVRGYGEHETVALPGSELIPLPELAERLDEVPRDHDVVAYCHHGIRSKSAAALLISS